MCVSIQHVRYVGLKELRLNISQMSLRPGLASKILPTPNSVLLLVLASDRNVHSFISVNQQLNPEWPLIRQHLLQLLV